MPRRRATERRSPVTEPNTIEPDDLEPYEAGKPDPGGGLTDPGLRDLSAWEVECRRLYLRLTGPRQRPGEPIPAWWAACPICGGSGCPLCDGDGQMHPKEASWLEDALFPALSIADLAARLWTAGEGPRAAAGTFALAIDQAAAEFVEARLRPGETEADLDDRLPRPTKGSEAGGGPSDA
jgi:hypothetical protein